MSISSSSGSSDGKSPAVAANAAEREAQRRITEAARHVREAEREMSKQLDEIKDEYVKQSVTEQSRHQAQLEAERQKSYRAVRELQKQSVADKGRISRQGDRDLTELKDHYRDSLYTTVKNNENELDRLKLQQTKHMDFERRQGRIEQEQSQSEHLNQIQAMRTQHEEQQVNLKAQQRKEYEELASKTETAREQSRAHFDERYKSLINQQDEIIQNTWDRASKEIRKTREGTASKLAAYNERQSDPFYKLVNLDAQVAEYADEYVLTAKIPEHERAHVVVSVKGNNIVINGARRNEERLEQKDGSAVGTSSYQSYYETFPVIWPVESKQMTRQYEGENLVVRIPKKDPSRVAPQYIAKKPEPARAERPKFPDNLPYTEIPDMKRTADSDEPLKEPVSSKSDTRKPSRGSGTLG